MPTAAATPEKKTTGSWSRVLRSQPRPISPASSPPDVAMPPSTIAAWPLIAVCMNVPNSPGMVAARARYSPLRPPHTKAIRFALHTECAGGGTGSTLMHL